MVVSPFYAADLARSFIPNIFSPLLFCHSCFRHHSVFTKFDKDKSGTMDMKEFYQLIGEKQSIFGDSIFELIDVDNSGTLDYSEFVAACGHFWYV